MYANLKNKFAASSSAPVPEEGGKKKRRRVTLTEPTDDVAPVSEPTITPSSDRPLLFEPAPSILVAASEPLSYPPGQRIFRPEWDMKENESVVGNSASASKFMEKAFLPADVTYVAQKPDNAFLAESAQASVASALFMGEAIKRLSLHIETEARNAAKIDALQVELRTAEIDLDIARATAEHAKNDAADKEVQMGKMAEELKASKEQLRAQGEKHKAEMEALRKELNNGVTLAYEEAFGAVKKLVQAQFSDLDLSGITIQATLACVFDKTEGTTSSGEEEEDVPAGKEAEVQQQPRDDAEA